MSAIISQGLLAASLLLGQAGGSDQLPPLPSLPPLPTVQPDRTAPTPAPTPPVALPAPTPAPMSPSSLPLPTPAPTPPVAAPAPTPTLAPTIPMLPPAQPSNVVPAQNTVPAPPVVTQQPSQPSQRPILGFFTREDRPILNRIQGWFKRDDPQQQPPQGYRSGQVIRDPAPPTTPPAFNPPMPAPGGSDFPRRLPNPSSQASFPADPLAKESTGISATDIQLASLQQAIQNSPIRRDLANKIGRDEKFEWITGQFEIENGNFVLYYATPETVDKYNGRIVLLPDKTDLKQYRRGDLISVRGQVSQRTTMQGMVAIYHVTLATLIDRPK